MKNQIIRFRIESSKKEKWLSECQKRNISLSEYIINAVEETMDSKDYRKLISFIEQQDNLFIKVQTNINQIARIANHQKQMATGQMERFQKQLDEVIHLKIKQNEMFNQIYSFLAKN